MTAWVSIDLRSLLGDPIGTGWRLRELGSERELGQVVVAELGDGFVVIW